MSLRWVLFLSLALNVITSCNEEGDKQDDQFYADKAEEIDEKSMLVQLNDSLEKDPDNIDLWIRKGNYCKEALDFKCALDAGAKAFILDSTNLDARRLYAWTLVNKPKAPVEDIERAQRHYKYILSVNQKDPATMVELANTFSLTGDIKTAFKYINDALRIDQEYRDAYVLKGSIYKTMGNNELALSSYQTALQLDPDFFIGHLNTGWLLTEMGKHELALEYYENAHELNPQNINAQYGIAKSYQDMEEFDRALAEYRELEAIDSSFYITYYNQGVIKQYFQNQLDSAVYFYDKLLSIEPEYIDGWVQLGRTYFAQDRKSDAGRAYSRALKIDEDYGPAKAAAEELRKSL